MRNVTIVMTLPADIRTACVESERRSWRTMAKKKRKVSADEQAAFDERTKMINEYIERLRQRVESRKAAEKQS
jgi:hypothetical protein